MSRWSVKLVGGAGAVALAAFVVVGFGIEAASAGGWAISSLDQMAAPVAGQQMDVGFTIRQHGVTPLENPGGEVGLNIRSQAGSNQFFPATASGPPGHYVARVRIAAPGTYSWQIHQGWFDVQPLGRIDVAAPTGAAAGTAGDGSGTATTYRWPLSVRVLLPALGVGLAAFAVADAILARRRRSVAPTAPHPIEA